MAEQRGGVLDDRRERDRLAAGPSRTREKSVSVRVIASTRAMLDWIDGEAALEHLGRGAAPRLQDLHHRVDRRERVAHLVADPGDHEPERGEARRLHVLERALGEGRLVDDREHRAPPGGLGREPLLHDGPVRLARDRHVARGAEIAGERGVVLGEQRVEPGPGRAFARTRAHRGARVQHAPVRRRRP